MKRRNLTNTLFFKIFCTVIVGIISLSIVLNVVNISISKHVFIQTFSESQQKIFNQIDREFYEFYADLGAITVAVASSGSVQRYLNGMDSTENAVQEMRNIYNMKQQMDRTSLSEYSSLNMLVIGKSGKNYLYNKSAQLSVDIDNILNSSITEKAEKYTGRLVCEYQKSGFTDVMKDEPVITFAKALSYDAEQHVAGYVYLQMKETEFQKMYSHFASETSSIVVMTGDNEVISASSSIYLDKESKERERLIAITEEMQENGLLFREIKDKSHVQSVLLQKMENTNYKLVGIIDPETAFARQYDLRQTVLLAILVSAGILFIIFVLVRQQTRPLQLLAEKMKEVRNGNFDDQLELKGTEEIRQLTDTYNEMTESLKHYVERLMEAEKEKRNAELNALQMQINPHYMYNTLASIKWLIWQGNTSMSVEVIDSFITLLRNTISNDQEFITLEQEIKNLENYVMINRVRYGDAVQVEYYVPLSCNGCLVPKLFLQPFVENAFFHGFPEGRKGNIRIFVQVKDQKLQLVIEDNGIGMGKEGLEGVRRREKSEKKEHFTGIGINNVDDRIRMIYGEEYGVEITSRENVGTKVTLTIPIKK